MPLSDHLLFIVLQFSRSEPLDAAHATLLPFPSSIPCKDRAEINEVSSMLVDIQQSIYGGALLDLLYSRLVNDSLMVLRNTEISSASSLLTESILFCMPLHAASGRTKTKVYFYLYFLRTATIILPYVQFKTP